MNGIDRRALLRGLISLPAITPALTLPAAASEALRPDLEGMGVICLNERFVYFDTNQWSYGDEVVVRPGPCAVDVLTVTDKQPAPGEKHFCGQPPVHWVDMRQCGWSDAYWVPSVVFGRVLKGDQ